MCLHDRYFDAFSGAAGWIESVTTECREKLRTGEIDASSLDVPGICARKSLSRFAARDH